MRCEPWMDRTPAEHWHDMAMEATWRRDGNAIQRCDALTGHMSSNVAYCDSEQTAEFILQAIRERQSRGSRN